MDVALKRLVTAEILHGATLLLDLEALYDNIAYGMQGPWNSSADGDIVLHNFACCSDPSVKRHDRWFRRIERSCA